MFNSENSPLVKLFMVEYARDYRHMVRSGIPVTEHGVAAIMGREVPKRSRFFGIF